jgi:hypothetical protein
VIAAETLFEAPCGEIRFFRGRRWLPRWPP